MKTLKDRILDAVSEDLTAIEEALRNNLNPYLNIVSHVADYLICGGGKRIRPLLAVLSARLCGCRDPFAFTLSAVFEYLHVATLLHDDLVDGADVRRGHPAAHTVWGNPAAVLVGDFLLARSITIAAQTGQVEIIDTISEATARMSEGEIHQLLHRGNVNLTEAEYMDVIGRKTACLIQAACHSGALLARGEEAQIRALAAYGNDLGYAFQLVDDLLDYTADPTVLGKSTGTDLKEGKVTLPLIWALNHAEKNDRDTMAAIIGTDEPTASEFAVMLDLVEKYGGITHAQRMAKDRVKAAKDRLGLFDTSETRKVLEDLADYVLTREV